MEKRVERAKTGGRRVSKDEKPSPFHPELAPVNAPETSLTKQKIENGGKSGTELLALLPGIMLIMLSGLFLLEHNGYLEGEWWQYFLVGFGVVFLMESMMQYQASKSRRAKIGRLITGIALIVCGLLLLFHPNQWWPWVLMGLGILSCVRRLWLIRKTKPNTIQ
jgi:hypothetical protein